MLNEADKIIVSDFKGKISVADLRHISEIIVFGSRARGDIHDSSDLDIAVLVDEKTEQLENRLEAIAYDVMYKNDFKIIFSLKLFANDHFQRALMQGFSFYVNVKKEGVSV